MARRPPNRDRPDDTKTPAFAFCVTGQAVSAQTKNRHLLRGWKADVEKAARAAWPAGQLPLTADLVLRVTQYSERRKIDRDNLLKPIQDALQGICYENDRQLKDSICNWRDIDEKFAVRSISMILAIAFSNGEPFLHIRLFMSPDTEDLG